MKKLIICAAVLAAGLFATSCKDTNYCWEMKYTISVLGTETTITNYVWGTQNELDAAIAEVKQTVGEDVKINYKRTSKAESECYKDAE